MRWRSLGAIGIVGGALVALAAGAKEPAAGGATSTSNSADAPKASAEASDETEDSAEEESSEPGLGDEAPPAAATKKEPPPSPLTPRADEFPKERPALDTQALDALLGEIATLRGRVAALTTTLFASKLVVVFDAEGDDSRFESLTITLDGGVIYSAPKKAVTDEPIVVYEHAVAPGYHTIGVETERYDVRSKDYKHWQQSKFSVLIPDKKKLRAHISLSDDSDIAEDFPEDEDGEYELGTRLRAQVVE